MNKIKQFQKAMVMEIKEHKTSFAVYMLLRILVIVVMILQIMNQNYENVFLCILTLLLMIIPSFIQVSFKIELPTTLEVIILLFIFSAEILGETQSFYLIFPMWDTILHTLNGFLAAAIGFSLVDLMNKVEKFQFQLSPLFMAIVAFSFSMSIGVIWEIFEYGMDTFAGLDMQKDTIVHHITSVLFDPTQSNIPITIDNIHEVYLHDQPLALGGYVDIGLIDTMLDLIVNLIGAAVFSLFGYIYVKNRGKGNFVNRFIPKRKDKKHDYLLACENTNEYEVIIE